jgi:putative hydrolase
MADEEVLAQDWHVHSTFSDGRAEPIDNLARASDLGLTEVCFVDHVRRYSDWVPSFIQEITRLRADADMVVRCSVEAKILDRSGQLDLPTGVASLAGLDLVHIADHKFPLSSGPADPADVRRALASGSVSPEDLIESLVEATERAIGRVPRALIAHLFSILPKVGLDESQVPHDAIATLASAAARLGALVEVNEKWGCPSHRTLRAFQEAGVRIVASSDAHEVSAIGSYGYVRRTLAQLGAEAAATRGA